MRVVPFIAGLLMALPVQAADSALILGEPVGWSELVSMLLICGALTFVLLLPAMASRRGTR